MFERLTNPKHGGIRSMRLPLSNQAAIYQRLAAYEDSGLSPEEVQELAKAKADGRLVELPVKVGDTIWLAMCGQIREYIFMGITQQYGYLPSLYGRQRFGKYEDVGIALVDSIGKTVFLSRETAEKALGVGK
jgi:hypothetical protein